MSKEIDQTRLNMIDFKLDSLLY